MKKFLCLILSVACLLMTATLFSCGGYPKPASIVYTTEILINQEPFPTNLVWYSTLEGPADGGAVIPVSPYHTKAIVGAEGISEAPKMPKEKTLQELLGLTKEAYAKDFGKMDQQKYLRYADTELMIFCVAGDAVYNGQPVTHAGKRMIAERCGDAVYLTDITEILLSSGELWTSYEGRIGSKYYFDDGYYDLNTHEAKPFAEENDLPPQKHEAFIEYNYFALDRFFRDHETAGTYLQDMSCQGACQVGNRLYVVMATGNRYHDGRDEEGKYIYEGEDICLVTVDTETDRVLYLQKYHLNDYWGQSYILFQTTSEGILQMPMAEE